MMKSPYQTAPAPSPSMPRGIPYIIGNEAAERFSFYGMRALLVVFMTRHLVDANGNADLMSEAEAKSLFHLFTFGVYATPLLGALLSDIWLGKYRTIISLSLVYCLGHAVLAVDTTRQGLALGLFLIALGSGGIKPCVSAHVGDQFGRANAHLLSRVFGYFYFAINLGAFISMLLTPYLLKHFGPHVAFGVPGGLMLLATIVFWAGRHRFVHVPPGRREFTRQLFDRENLRNLVRLATLYLFVAMFWSLFDQSGSAWVLQANHMDRHFLGIEWHAAQIQAANPILIMLLIPTFNFAVYPWLDRVVHLTPLRKIAVGFFLIVIPFLINAQIELWISSGERPDIGWHLFAFVILTAAEVLVSITCLEFSYTQAPKALKSMVMALYLTSVSLGNLFTSAVNFLIQDEQGNSRLSGVDYYLFFAGAMFLTALLFIPFARRYHERAHLQDEADSGEN